MRNVIARIPSKHYRAGSRLRLFGPDTAGLLDDSAPQTTGDKPVHAPRSAETTWGESAWGRSPWGGARRYAGWARTPWASAPWAAETLPIEIIGDAHAYGVVEYGVQARDARGNLSAAPTAVQVLVNAKPAEPAAQTIAVAAGVVTLTLTPRPS